MNITQRHDQGNHTPHWKGANNYSDKPWDEACKDGGRSYFEPQNDFIIEEVLGLGNNTTNTVRLKSVNKLYIPYRDEPEYLYITLSHMNEDNLSQVKMGQILKKGTKILLEGVDGYATGNHFHITANIGTYYGFLQNNNGSWCLTYEKSLLPDEAFYLDLTYTNVINNAGYMFNSVPEKILMVGDPVSRDENIDQIEINAKNVYCRETPGLSGVILGYITKGVYNYMDTVELDGYNWYNIGFGWVAYNSLWGALYPKTELIIPSDKSEKQQNIFQRTINWIVNIFKKIFRIK